MDYLDPRSYKFHKLEKRPYNSSNWKFAHTILYLPVSYHVLHSCILGPTYILYFPPFECITPVSVLCSSPIDFLCSSFLYARTLGLPPSPFGVGAAVARPAARCLPLPDLPRAICALQRRRGPAVCLPQGLLRGGVGRLGARRPDGRVQEGCSLGLRQRTGVDGR